MENATKALLLAGGILIALMIIGALMLMFTNLAEYRNKQDSAIETQQIAELNNQFSPYDKERLTLMELKTLYNKIESYNSKNDPDIATNISEVYPNINKSFKYEIIEDDKIIKVFKCKKVEYKGPGGRISSMEFEDITPSKSQQ